MLLGWTVDVSCLLSCAWYLVGFAVFRRGVGGGMGGGAHLSSCSLYVRIYSMHNMSCCCFTCVFVICVCVCNRKVNFYVIIDNRLK